MKFIETSKGYINPEYITEFIFREKKPRPESLTPDQEKIKNVYGEPREDEYHDFLYITFTSKESKTYRDEEATSLYNKLKSL